MRVMGNGIFG